VRDVLNISTGTRQASFDYDPYGDYVQSAGPASPEPLYAGMQYLPEGGLYLTRHRAYDRSSGRWLSRDRSEKWAGLICTAMSGGTRLISLIHWDLKREYSFHLSVIRQLIMPL